MSPNDYFSVESSAIQGSSAELATRLQDECGRILVNWSMRIATLPVFRAIPDLALDDLQQDIPSLLDAILAAAFPADFEIDGEWIERASSLAHEHGYARASGFPIHAILAEMQMVHHEVREAIWRIAGGFGPDDIHALSDRLNRVFDAVEQASMSGWADYFQSRHIAETTGAAA